MNDSLAQSDHHVDGGIILVRHGEGEHNTRYIDNSNPENPRYQPVRLTARGRSQVRDTASQLSEMGITGDKICKFIVSPLPRTLETADILIGKLQKPLFTRELDARAIEADLGERDGKDYQQFNAPDFWFPENPERFGGESTKAIQQRMSALVDSLVNESDCDLQKQYIIVVSHGSPILLTQQRFGLGDERLDTAGFRIIPYTTLQQVITENKDSASK